MIDIAAAVEWMHELEARVSLDERALVPVNDVMAVTLGAEPGPEFTAAVMAELKRCRDLANNHYAKFTDSPPDSPGLLIGVGFLQGTTFARAVLDVGKREPHG